MTTTINFAKRITSLGVENYRAFYGVDYERLIFPNGENVLIYGENGSGKSSLFKALNDYFLRSRDRTKSFVTNRYSTGQRGQIVVEFADFAPSTNQIQVGSNQTFIFSSTQSTNSVQFIQDAALVKGFLEYRNLLDVYLHREPEPNLFELIVLSLLGDYIPVSAGSVTSLRRKWEALNDNLFLSHNRLETRHKNAVNELPIFEANLRSVLTNVFQVLNTFLSTYFQDLRIELGYLLSNITLNYHTSKSKWKLVSDLRLFVVKDGIIIRGDYGDILNEARLSAIAICLFLASLKCNPSLISLRILYLDDIFIGLDAGNRIPILNIVQSEFSDYQVFISTYDRHWFELAKRFFDVHAPDRWKSFELYVTKETIGSLTFDRPTVLTATTDFEKGIHYLHHRSHPDLPAAANYFRKAIEQIIREFIPIYELIDTDGVQMPDYKLSKTIESTRQFLHKAGENTSSVDQIISLLHGLVHPLSHYSISAPVYKGELLNVERAIRSLHQHLKNLDIANNFRCILDSGKKVKLTFCANQIGNHYFYYELKIKESLVLRNVPGSNPVVCTAACHADKFYGINGATPIPGGNPRKDDPIYKYESIQDAYEKIYNYLNGTVVNFAKVSYETACEFSDQQVWAPLAPLLVW